MFYRQIRYRLKRLGAEEWGPPHTLPGVLLTAQRKMRSQGGKVRLQRRGEDDWSAPMRRAVALRRLERRLSRGRVGVVWRFWTDADSGPVYAIRKTQRRLPLRQTEGNERIDLIYTAVVSEFRGVESFGICSRRSIRGDSTSWSQHSPWPSPDPGSNAWDLHHDRFATMDAIAAFLVRKADELRVGRVIFNRRIWDPAQGWHAYGGSNPHTDHPHVEGDPERSGTPRPACP